MALKSEMESIIKLNISNGSINTIKEDKFKHR